MHRCSLFLWAKGGYVCPPASQPFHSPTRDPTTILLARNAATPSSEIISSSLTSYIPINDHSLMIDDSNFIRCTQITHILLSKLDNLIS
eukprot:scaffold4072_cov126-Skeletonema_dohrnii-CCMP3373.AAC.1